MRYKIRLFLLALLMLTIAPIAMAADNTTTKNNKPGIYDNLYEIYQEIAKHRGDSTCIALSDSLRRQARRQGDARAAAMSWAHLVSYYMGKNKEKEFYAVTDSLMQACEPIGFWSFYYYGISQKAVFMLRREQLGEALQLGEETMQKAYADNNKNGIYVSHTIMLNCYMSLCLYDKAEEEAQKALAAELELTDNNFGNSLIKLAELRSRQHKWQACLDVIAKYESQVQGNATVIRLTEYKAMCSYCLGRLDDYHQYKKEAQALYEEFGVPATNFSYRIFKGMDLMEEGKMKEAESNFKQLGVPDRFTYLSILYQRTDNADSLATVMDDQDRYWATLHERLYDTDVKKYGLEMENSQLEQANRMLAAKRIRARFYWAMGCLALLVLGITVLYWSKRRSNKQLQRANRKLERRTRQLQDNLEAVRKANQANDAKSAFLFNMSHDIRTPMNAIMGFSDLLAKHKDDPELVNDYITKIKSSGDYLLSLINNVLDMARIESGKAELDEEFYDMEDPANNVSTLFEQLARQKNITLTHSNTVEHRYVMLDAMKVKQVMVNLLSNSIKYTPEGGHVNYEFKEVPCEREGYATYVSIISDDGIGMSQEFAKTIFEMFTRERNTTESKVVGTGLGMSIVKRLVDMMGGTIDLQTEKGKGTTFTVTMTHKIVEHPEEYLTQGKQEAEVTDIDLNGKRILLAEDNDLNAEIAISVLEEMGLKVERAEDGVQCIDMLTGSPVGYYDCILMDVQMPRLNGYDATRHIRLLDNASRANIPIIAMTANAFEEDKRNAIEAGMNGHLAKPINVAEIMKTLSRVLK